MSAARWLLVAGDVRPSGGMDIANHALASYLARQDSTLHLVTHAASTELGAAANVRVHRVPRPFGVHRLGFPLLRAAARRVHRQLGPGTRAIANGGNADLGADQVRDRLRRSSQIFNDTAAVFLRRATTTDAGS